jgi:hypothetical protein
MTAKLSSFGALNNTVSFDSFQRDYQVNMTQYVSMTKPQFEFNQFVNFPVGNGFQIGVNNTYNVPSIGYAKGLNSISYSYMNNFLGSSGEGLLGYSGNTHYINYEHNNIKDNTGYSFGFTTGYAVASNSSESLLTMSNAVSVGARVKVLYSGFGLVGYVPSKIISGTATANTPVGSDINGNILYASESMDLSKGVFEKTVGFVYEGGKGINTYGIEISSTHDTYGILGMNSNNIKLRNNWYF